MDAFFISNMMIERFRFEDYSEDWESQFTEDVLRATRLSQQQVSTSFGGHSDVEGGFVTSSPAQNRIQAKIDTALLPEWKNVRMYEVEILIPKGETLSIGKVVPQKISSSETVLKRWC